MRGVDFAASPSWRAIVASRRDDEATRLARIEAVDSASEHGSVIGVPANASRALVDAVKAAGRLPRFVPLDEWGVPCGPELPEVVWVQAPIGCHGPLDALRGHVVLLDAPDTRAESPSVHVVTAGVIDTHEREVADRQTRRCIDVAFGVHHAAALPVMPIPTPSVHGIIAAGAVVRLPGDCDATTFVAYAEAELTGIGQLARRRPLHPQAPRHLPPDDLARTIRHLERLLLLDVGPDFTDDEVAHAVLGLVKSAEYTGWRWHGDPDHAVTYEALLSARYGTEHEAYRPAFLAP